MKKVSVKNQKREKSNSANQFAIVENLGYMMFPSKSETLTKNCSVVLKARVDSYTNWLLTFFKGGVTFMAHSRKIEKNFPLKTDFLG